jgi:hypothetical protein
MVERESAESESEDANEALVDFRQFAQYAGFVIRATVRHPILTLGTFLLAFAMTATAAILLPKTYHTQVKLLAQRNAVMTALSNPGRAVPWDADAPTRAAKETVLQRENLLNVMKQTDLLNEWERTRVPLLRFKDWLTDKIVRRRPTPEEKIEQLLGLLETRLLVSAGAVGDGTVTIDLDWPNATMAFRLVEAAQINFIKARQQSETATIGESITILERYASTLHDDIDRTLAELKRAQSSRRSGTGAGSGRLAGAALERAPALPSLAPFLPPVSVPATGDALDSLEDPQIPKLKAAMAAKRAEIESLEEAKQRQLSELHNRLAQLTAVYTATHPAVLNAQQNIEALSHDTPQLTTLKAQAEALDADYQKRVAAAEELAVVERVKKSAVPIAANPAQEVPTTFLPAAVEPTNQLTPDSPDFTSVRFRLELNQLESVLERIDGARIEMAVSQAAFKYRYTVVRPAEVPRRPIRPNLLAIIAAGAIGSLLLAVSAGVTRDLLSDRILEAWQVERQLVLPIVGTPGDA